MLFVETCAFVEELAAQEFFSFEILQIKVIQSTSYSTPVKPE